MSVDDPDWTALSPRAKAIAMTIGDLYATGFSMAEIGRSLGSSDAFVASLLGELRAELEAQLEPPPDR